MVLYGYETWSIILREEQKLRKVENRVLRKKVGPNRDDRTVEWRGLRNEVLYDL